MGGYKWLKQSKVNDSDEIIISNNNLDSTFQTSTCWVLQNLISHFFNPLISFKIEDYSRKQKKKYGEILFPTKYSNSLFLSTLLRWLKHLGSRLKLRFISLIRILKHIRDAKQLGQIRLQFAVFLIYKSYKLVTSTVAVIRLMFLLAVCYVQWYVIFLFVWNFNKKNHIYTFDIYLIL